MALLLPSFILLINLITINGFASAKRPYFDDSVYSRPRCYPHCCSPISIPNGMVRLTRRTARFSCPKNFTIIGEATLFCHRSKWEPEPPVCAAPGCEKLTAPKNGAINEVYRNLLVNIVCNPGYTADGITTAYCDGRYWNASTGSIAKICKKPFYPPATSCDFETRDQCGWNAEEPERVTIEGPLSTTYELYGLSSADHTSGRGHMLVIWNSASVDSKINSTNRLFSPVFESKESEACFVFWYHLGGYMTKTEPPTIKMFIKPDSFDLNETKAFDFLTTSTAYGSWQQAHLYIPKMYQDWQIIFEFPIWNKIYALDDFSLEDAEKCAKKIPTSSNSTELRKDYWPSCASKCNDTDAAGFLCSCSSQCLLLDNCCPDYRVACIYNSSKSDDDDYMDDILTRAFNISMSTPSWNPFHPFKPISTLSTLSSDWYFTRATSRPRLTYASAYSTTAKSKPILFPTSPTKYSYSPRFSTQGMISSTTQPSTVPSSSLSPISSSLPSISTSTSPTTVSMLSTVPTVSTLSIDSTTFLLTSKAPEQSTTVASLIVNNGIQVNQVNNSSVNKEQTVNSTEDQTTNATLSNQFNVTTLSGQTVTSPTLFSNKSRSPISGEKAKLESTEKANIHVITALIATFIIASIAGVFLLWRRHKRIMLLNLSEDSELRFLAQDEGI